jgi:hypothetical protein
MRVALVTAPGNEKGALEREMKEQVLEREAERERSSVWLMDYYFLCADGTSCPSLPPSGSK